MSLSYVMREELEMFFPPRETRLKLKFGKSDRNAKLGKSDCIAYFLLQEHHDSR